MEIKIEKIILKPNQGLVVQVGKQEFQISNTQIENVMEITLLNGSKFIGVDTDAGFEHQTAKEVRLYDESSGR